MDRCTLHDVASIFLLADAEPMKNFNNSTSCEMQAFPTDTKCIAFLSNTGDGSGSSSGSGSCTFGQTDVPAWSVSIMEGSSCHESVLKEVFNSKKAVSTAKSANKMAARVLAST